jgi:hypothetical protein
MKAGKAHASKQASWKTADVRELLVNEAATADSFLRCPTRFFDLATQRGARVAIASLRWERRRAGTERREGQPA